MTAEHERPPVPGGPEADAADEATGTASSAHPASELRSEEPSSDGAVRPQPHEHQREAAAEEPPAEERPVKEAPVDEAAVEEAQAADHEAQLEHDLEELAARAEKADEYLELAQRTKADFENYRKRAARETAAAQERGLTKLARELLPAVDNLDRALAAAGSVVQAQDAGGGETAAKLVSGIELVHDEVIAALARVGIKPFSPEGEPFDPQRHEAVAQQPIEGAEAGTVVEVYQRGYTLGDLVIRPARVLVAG